MSRERQRGGWQRELLRPGGAPSSTAQAGQVAPGSDGQLARRLCQVDSGRVGTTETCPALAQWTGKPDDPAGLFDGECYDLPWHRCTGWKRGPTTPSSRQRKWTAFWPSCWASRRSLSRRCDVMGCQSGLSLNFEEKLQFFSGLKVTPFLRSNFCSGGSVFGGMYCTST